jgi:predicted AlkP superfamily phosphohydrolase/phosphomutase
VAYQSASGGGISVNLRGREPGGVVDPADFGPTRDRVRDALLAYRDGATGDLPVARVQYREDLPAGPYADLAPDLIAGPAAGWSFAHTDAMSAPTEWPSGSHRGTGILVAHGGSVRAGRLGTRYIGDLAPTALAFCGLELPGLDGHVIEEISGTGPMTVAAGDEGATPERVGSMSDEDNEFMSQHLRDLGYIE